MAGDTFWKKGQVVPAGSGLETGVRGLKVRL